jgi:arylsulfatase A-like enzyme
MKQYYVIQISFLLLLPCFYGCNSNTPVDKAQSSNSTDTLVINSSRLNLPYPGPEYQGKIDSTYKTSVPDFGPALPLTAPPGAPNIIIVLLDDVGFGQLGCYGGQIETPNIDKLAKQGIKYINFHTTALCSPSRAALLTGRNHHSVGMAAITEAATGYPSNNGTIPKSAAFISETLKDNGYNTMAFGKWHLTPYTSYTVSGPMDRWPLAQGFESFYGFLGGETDEWSPLLMLDNHAIDNNYKPGQHFSEDMTDKAIAAIRDQQQSNTGKPFFTYFATGAAHAPLHAPKAFIEKYRGKFDMGWDAARKQIFERQKTMGIIPKNALLPPGNEDTREWNSLTTVEKKVYARLQEVFAGYLDHADQQIGRLVAVLDEMHIRDNTMILVMSDNGASREGEEGTINTDRYRNLTPQSAEEMLPHFDEIGGPASDPHYPKEWSMAGNAPLRRWKQDTHAGGNTDPLIISWPGKIKDTGTIRRQYHHIVDIMPTLLAVSHLPAPKKVNGVDQMPLPGVSMEYTFDHANEPTHKKIQYYEMLGSRAIWAEGWKAVCLHKKDAPYAKDIWELYNTDLDFTESNDLAKINPDKLKELIDLWWGEAKKYNVLPLDDRRNERLADPSRPVAAIVKPSYTFYPGTSNLHPLTFPNLMSQSHTITAFVEIPNGGVQGVLACSGSAFGGWTLFIKEGKLYYVHNYLQIKEYAVSSNVSVIPGKHQFKVHYSLKQKSLKPNFFIGDVDIYIDDKLVGNIKDVKMAGQYSAVTGYGILIGRNPTQISKLYKSPFPFSGKLEKVTIELK